MSPNSQWLSLLLLLATSTQGQEDLATPDLREVVAELARQVQLQQFAFEEKTRQDGGSGLKQQRGQIIGSKPYNTPTHTGFKIAAMHDHSNNRNTVGLGESSFVLNGVEFRTRHNDYPLYQPHATSDVYNAVQEIEYPEVPPEVTAKATVLEQVEEMKKWFQAWARQDHSVRDYRKYFKPVLCYLEAGWTAATNKLEEAFHSDRHFIDADSWTDLQEKVRYNAYMGRKNSLENYAYLPRTIMNITEGGLPVYAQWNYRVLCHPLKEDLPLDRLVQEDDLQARMLYKMTLREFSMMRGARYRVDGGPKERRSSWTLLDDLMKEIPGRDNYQGYLTEETLGEHYFDPSQRGNKTLLNVAYFHRRYNLGAKDAMGSSAGMRSFSDPNVFVAENTQDRIAPMHVRVCDRKHGRCLEAKKRVTYALPLEVIYLTPIHRWNPYNIPFASDTLRRKSRGSGGFTRRTAYKVTGQNSYYRTPVELFQSGEVEQRDAADTALPKVGVQDGQGIVREVMASGVRIFLPPIEGLGVLRTRYPIMPIHGESSSVWKELNALKDIVMNLKSRQHYLYQKLPTSSPPQRRPTKIKSDSKGKGLAYVVLTMAQSDQDGHAHTVNVTAAQRSLMMRGQAVSVQSSVTDGHSHYVTCMAAGGRYFIVKADGADPPTADGHAKLLQWSLIGSEDGSIRYRRRPVERSSRRKRSARAGMGRRGRPGRRARRMRRRRRRMRRRMMRH